MNRVSFNLPSFNVESNLIAQEMFGYYDHQKVKLSIHIFRANFTLSTVWIVRVFSDHFIFADCVAKAELPGENDLYSVMVKADIMVKEFVATRQKVTV